MDRPRAAHESKSGRVTVVGAAADAKGAGAAAAADDAEGGAAAGAEGGGGAMAGAAAGAGAGAATAAAAAGGRVSEAGAFGEADWRSTRSRPSTQPVQPLIARTCAHAPTRATTRSSILSESLVMGGRVKTGASQAAIPPGGTTCVGDQPPAMEAIPFLLFCTEPCDLAAFKGVSRLT
ncbi:MAG: hypothetical protein ABSG37_09055 [Candidatus Limnocylindrales bacterium]